MTQLLHAYLSLRSKMPVIYKAHCRVAFQLAVPPKYPDGLYVSIQGQGECQTPGCSIMNGVCCISKMLKRPRQWLNTEPARTWLGPCWLASHDWLLCLSQTAACLPASPDRTDLSPAATKGEGSVLKDPAQSVWNTITAGGVSEKWCKQKLCLLKQELS